jgi:hypothetical protein
VTNSEPLGDLRLSTLLEQAQINLSLQKSTLPTAILLAENAFLNAFVSLNDKRDTSIMSAFLFSYNSWRQAIVMIASGGPAHSCLILRKSLETSLQGYLFARDAKMAKLWRESGSGRGTDQVFAGLRKQLAAAKRARTILKAENSEIASSFNLIEGQLIDAESHPIIETGLEISLEVGEYARQHWVSPSDVQSGAQGIAWLLAALTAEAELRLVSLVFPESVLGTSFEELLFTIALHTFDMK